MKKALEKLSFDCKIILILRYNDHLKFREIAEILEKPLNTVKSYHRRAIILLGKYLKKRFLKIKMETILRVQKLNVELEKEKIICNLSFDLEEGKTLTILGPNGAGKTVLLKTLLGFFPYEGKIEWRKNVRIGYVPQRLPFVKDLPLSVEEFFHFKKVKKNKIEEVLRLFGFQENFLKKNIGEISSGQYQRILIAWALLENPDVLLFDEPTTGIDTLGQETIYQLLERLKNEKKLTIILVTHDLSVVFKFSDYVICLNKCPLCQGVAKEVINPEILSKLYGQEIKFYEHYHEH